LELGWGEQQLQQAKTSVKKISDTLTDGKWHRYGEILSTIRKTSRISSATLSKWLKKMEAEGLIKKKVDIKSGKYPYPAFYQQTPLLEQELQRAKIKCDLGSLPDPQFQAFRKFMYFLVRHVFILAPKDAKAQDYLEITIDYFKSKPKEKLIRMVEALAEREKSITL